LHLTCTAVVAGRLDTEDVIQRELSVMNSHRALLKENPLMFEGMTDQIWFKV